MINTTSPFKITKSEKRVPYAELKSNPEKSYLIPLIDAQLRKYSTATHEELRQKFVIYNAPDRELITIQDLNPVTGAMLKCTALDTECKGFLSLKGQSWEPSELGQVIGEDSLLRAVPELRKRIEIDQGRNGYGFSEFEKVTQRWEPYFLMERHLLILYNGVLGYPQEKRCYRVYEVITHPEKKIPQLCHPKLAD
ncbi:hypothetical protein [Planktothrix sp.]|uniref:hypothetical protein n=1 Tax=Planktothrix sp. TaxID=3088171 RepID=UPI0038D435ED